MSSERPEAAGGGEISLAAESDNTVRTLKMVVRYADHPLGHQTTNGSILRTVVVKAVVRLRSTMIQRLMR